jgi:Secretion system C-terminal sorting domain
MGQAFWIKANAPGALIIIHEASKTDTIGGQFYRKSNSDLPVGLKASLTKGDVTDNSFLLLREGTTDFYDRGFDVPKMEGEMMAISFQDPQGMKLGHFATSEIENAIPLNIHAANEGEYAISFEKVRNFDGLDELFLVDTYLGKSHSLASGTPYSFSVTSNSATKAGRFYLSRDPASVKEKELVVSVWPNPVLDKFNLEVNTNSNVSVSLLNSNGSTLDIIEIISSNGIAKGSMDMSDRPTGLYFVRASVDGKVVVRKILKR